MRKQEAKAFSQYLVRLLAHDEKLHALSDQMLRKFDEYQTFANHQSNSIESMKNRIDLIAERLDATDALTLRVVRAFDRVEAESAGARSRKRTKRGKKRGRP